jgi:hypothetical protein
MLDEALTRRRKGHAAAISHQKRATEGFLHAADACACRCASEVRFLGTVRDASRIGNMQKELQVDQIEPHAAPATAFVFSIG